MALALLIFGAAFAAFCVWLAVRIVNWRKKPGVVFSATIGLVVLLVGYPLSFGPACWLANRTDFVDDDLSGIYLPIGWFCEQSPFIESAMFTYARIGMTGTKDVWVPVTNEMWRMITVN